MARQFWISCIEAGEPGTCVRLNGHHRTKRGAAVGTQCGQFSKLWPFVWVRAPQKNLQVESASRSDPKPLAGSEDGHSQPITFQLPPGPTSSECLDVSMSLNPRKVPLTSQSHRETPQCPTQCLPRCVPSLDVPAADLSACVRLS